MRPDTTKKLSVETFSCAKIVTVKYCVYCGTLVFQYRDYVTYRLLLPLPISYRS